MITEKFVEDVRNLVAIDDNAAIDILKVIYRNQTAHERAVGHNSCYDGKGFNRCDVKMLMPIGLKADRGQRLNLREMAIVRWKIKKYVKQGLRTLERNNKLDEFLDEYGAYCEWCGKRILYTEYIEEDEICLCSECMKDYKIGIDITVDEPNQLRLGLEVA